MYVIYSSNGKADTYLFYVVIDMTEQTLNDLLILEVIRYQISSFAARKLLSYELLKSVTYPIHVYTF